MYSPPRDPATEQSMHAAFTAAAGALDVTPTGPTVWGWHGRTLSRRADHLRHGACWLRLVSAPAGKQGGKIWEGTAAASVLDGTVSKPALYAVHDQVVDDTAYRAELTQYIDAPTCSPDPVVRSPLELPPTWWKQLRADLDRIATVDTDRVAVRQEWIDRVVPQYTGCAAPRITEWTTAHGDLHLANITTSGVILDWEGWGLAPAGYDAALLLAYSLREPSLADQVRETFGDLITGESGRAVMLVVVADLLQSASRGDHPDLEPALRRLLEGRP